MTSDKPSVRSVQQSSDESMIEQFCRDLNEAHNEILRLQDVPRERWNSYDWPEWSGPANSIRWAEQRLGKPLSKRATFINNEQAEKANTAGLPSVGESTSEGSVSGNPEKKKAEDLGAHGPDAGVGSGGATAGQNEVIR